MLPAEANQLLSLGNYLYHIFMSLVLLIGRYRTVPKARFPRFVPYRTLRHTGAVGTIFNLLRTKCITAFKITDKWCIELQCSGSGPVGSVCFWASWIRIRIRNLSRSFRQQAKKWRKTFISTVLWLLFDFLSLKNDVNSTLKKGISIKT
jgi:hypothetical protein